MRASFKKFRASMGIAEVVCDACDGTGFAKATQPSEPGKRIFPATCKKCLGKGRIALGRANHS
jgi:DnaJ-class molecular chaperone